MNESSSTNRWDTCNAAIAPASIAPTLWRGGPQSPTTAEGGCFLGFVQLAPTTTIRWASTVQAATARTLLLMRSTKIGPTSPRESPVQALEHENAPEVPAPKY